MLNSTNSSNLSRQFSEDTPIVSELKGVHDEFSFLNSSSKGLRWHVKAGKLVIVNQKWNNRGKDNISLKRRGVLFFCQ